MITKWILLITLTLQPTDNVFESDETVFAITSGTVHMQSDTPFTTLNLCQKAAKNLPSTYNGLNYVIEDTTCRKVTARK